MIDDLIQRYYCGKVTDDEKQQLLEWLDSNPKEHIVELTRQHSIDLAAQVYGEQFMQGRRKAGRALRTWLTVAASVAALLIVWFASDLHTISRLSNRIVRLEVPAGQRMNTVLEDGTHISLNAGTTLEYPAIFARGDRRVKLSGEAIFEVEHDENRPFVVETFASEIEVRGTKFSVDAREEQGRFSAMLLEGQVMVRSRLNPSQSLAMKPHDRVELVGGNLYKTRVADFQELCWTEGIIHISKMPFDELMRRLERAYDVRIVIDRQTLPTLEVRSGKIRISEGIDYALHVLQQVSDFTYRYDEENNRIVIH